jgi:hypothetical protein
MRAASQLEIVSAEIQKRSHDNREVLRAILLGKRQTLWQALLDVLRQAPPLRFGLMQISKA